MTAFVVLGTDYEDVFVDSVWSTDKAAAEHSEAMNEQDGWNHNYHVVSVEMDKPAVREPGA